MTQPTDAASLPAGDLGSWLARITRALAEGTGMDVPCGDCTACCTSSQFVHIGPDETETLARIPEALQFAAPGLAGHVVLGYDQDGRCPMLVGGQCSIYDHRPRTCRSYDCRVFAATGVEPDGAQHAIALQARRWAFDIATDDDRDRWAALQRTAAGLAERFPHPTQRALAALRPEGAR